MIADGIGDPGSVGVSREEQRRRILFALEAPLPPPSAKPDGKPAPSLTARQRRIVALQKAIPGVSDPARRMDLTDELRELSRLERAENPPPPPHSPPPGPR